MTKVVFRGPGLRYNIKNELFTRNLPKNVDVELAKVLTDIKGFELLEDLPKDAKPKGGKIAIKGKETTESLDSILKKHSTMDARIAYTKDRYGVALNKADFDAKSLEDIIRSLYNEVISVEDLKDSSAKLDPEDGESGSTESEDETSETDAGANTDDRNPDTGGVAV